VSGVTTWLARWFRRLAAVALLGGLIALLAWLRTPERISDADGTPVHVMDGDSLRIGDRVVRLQGVDAVELRQSCADGEGGQWSCGLEARDALEALVARGGLRCLSGEQDCYRRAVARCSTKELRDIAARLVAQGWAVSGTGRNDGRYLAEQAEAKDAGRGIWRGPFARPADWRAMHPRPIED